MSMDFVPSEHHELLRKTVREFAQAEVAPFAQKWDAEERFPTEIVPKLESGAFPVWIGVGGSPESVLRAARHGFGLMLAPQLQADNSGPHHAASRIPVGE